MSTLQYPRVHPTKPAPIMGRHDILLFTSRRRKRINHRKSKVSPDPDVSLDDPSGTSSHTPSCNNGKDLGCIRTELVKDGNWGHKKHSDVIVDKIEEDRVVVPSSSSVSTRNYFEKNESDSSDCSSSSSSSSSRMKMSDILASSRPNPSRMMRSKDSMEIHCDTSSPCYSDETQSRHSYGVERTGEGLDHYRFAMSHPVHLPLMCNLCENVDSKYVRCPAEHDAKSRVEVKDKYDYRGINVHYHDDCDQQFRGERRKRIFPALDRRVIFQRYWETKHDQIKKSGIFQLSRNAVEVTQEDTHDERNPSYPVQDLHENNGDKSNQKIREHSSKDTPTKVTRVRKNSRRRKQQPTSILRKNCGIASTSDESSLPCTNMISEDADANVSVSCIGNGNTKSTSVSFSPQVSVLEFRRAQVEYPSSSRWFTFDEIAQFKREALQEVSTCNTQTCSSLSHGLHENCNNSCHRKICESRVDEKQDTIWREIHNFLIVDKHKSIHVLLARSIHRMFPHVDIRTACSTEEALKIIGSVKSNECNSTIHGFDIIILEEQVPEDSQNETNAGIEASSGANVTNSSSYKNENNKNLLRTISSEQISRGNERHSLLITLSPVSTATDITRLLQNGADLVWGVPPPRITVEIRDHLINAVLKKRGKKILQF